MNRKEFLGIASASVALVAGSVYLQSDRKHVVRKDMEREGGGRISLYPDEKEILYLASLAPSGHNTQPWIVQYIEPYHWIISNDRTKWLPAVDPDQRETMLSIGAFIQNLEYAANDLGYRCVFTLLAARNQDEDVMEVRLNKTVSGTSHHARAIELRRTVRSGYMNTPLEREHVSFLTDNDRDYFHFISKASKAYRWLSEKTFEANRQQVFRDDAQSELANWIRFSGREAKQYCDGLTTASMEIDGLAGWFVRNFYSKKDVMGLRFREQGLEKVRDQLHNSGGWLLISSNDSSTESLIEAGRRFQRMFLRVRTKSIAIHPMTQILEEPGYKHALGRSFGLSGMVQFILRIGYVKTYPDPVTLRRPVERFVRIQ